jgi:hypothetical protein
MKNTRDEGGREKIGTILDRKVAEILRERSENEGRTMSELIQEAVLTYRAEDAPTRERQLAAARRFFSSADEKERRVLKRVVELDYYEQ